MFIFPLDSPYSIGLRHGEPYPTWFQKLYHLSTHRGVDIITDKGKTIVAPANGFVIEKRWHIEGGNIVVIDHGNGIKSWMAHFDKTFVVQGQWIQQGWAIGEVGSTGISTGPHLHWHIYINGVVSDPLLYITNPTMKVIENLVKDLKTKLNNLLNGNTVIVQDVTTGKLYEIKDSKKEEFTFDALIRRHYLASASKEDLDKIPSK